MRDGGPGRVPAALAPTASIRGRILVGAAAVAALTVISVAQGLFPGMIYGGSINFFGEASARCMHDLGLHALTSWCHAIGAPAGFPLLTGGPLIMVAAALMHLPLVDSLGAYIAAQLVFDAIALAGMYGLMRRLGAGPWISLGTAAAWCLSPTVIGLEGFGGTWVGYVLLPAYAFMDLVVMDALDARRGRRALVLLLLAYAAVRTEALFMDGYSFVASALVSACLWVAWLVRRDRGWAGRLAGLAALAGANLVALVLYSLYRPVAFTTDPIEVFRSMGLDLITLVTPSNQIWFASKLRVAVGNTDLWGDTTNALYNYVGFVGLGLAVWWLVRYGRRVRVVLALAAAALIALVLSLGPALKLDVERPPVGPSAYYSMPKGEAPELPWARGFRKLPGLKSMRATYRWFGVTRMVLIVLAGLGLAQLARAPGRRRQVAVLLLAGVAVAEMLPTMPQAVRFYRDHYRDRVAIEREIARPFDRLTRPGERVFFLSWTGNHNDFLASYLAMEAGVRTYNTGGDKNVIFADSRWPREVKSIAGLGIGPRAVAAALRSGKVDVVVAPYFDPLVNSAQWPPAPEARPGVKRGFAPLLSSRALRVERTPWFATIRLRRG